MPPPFERPWYLVANRSAVSIGPGLLSDADAAHDGNLVVRKALRALNDDEMSRFVMSIKHMMNQGKMGPFVQICGMHAGTWDYETKQWIDLELCHHGLETFPHWHRIHLFWFEQALQDSHEVLYGNRHIGLPYWDWGYEGNPFPSWVEELIINTPLSDIREMMGEKPPSSVQMNNLWNQGYTVNPYADIHDSMSSHRKKVTTFLDAGHTHAEAVSKLETAHNGLHINAGFPLGKLAPSGFHVLFYMHHNYVDMLWESWLTMRSEIDGDRQTVMNEFKEEFPEAYHYEMQPLAKDDGSPWTAADTFYTRKMGYYFDELQTESAPSTVMLQVMDRYSAANAGEPAPPIKADAVHDAAEQAIRPPQVAALGLTKKRKHHRAHSVASKDLTTGASSGFTREEKAEVIERTFMTITFGAPESQACGLALDQDSFTVHVWVFDKDKGGKEGFEGVGHPFVAPETATLDDLGPEDFDPLEPLRTAYAGSVSLFGGAAPTMAHRTKLMLEVERIHMDVTKYEVEIRFERSVPSTDADYKKLFTSPDFGPSDSEGCLPGETPHFSVNDWVTISEFKEMSSNSETKMHYAMSMANNQYTRVRALQKAARK